MEFYFGFLDTTDSQPAPLPPMIGKFALNQVNFTYSEAGARHIKRSMPIKEVDFSTQKTVFGSLFDNNLSVKGVYTIADPDEIVLSGSWDQFNRV